MAPQSLISVKIFVQTLVNYCTLSYGSEILPSLWHHLAADRVETMAGILAADGEYIDWLLFILELAEPWPQASLNDLLTVCVSSSANLLYFLSMSSSVIISQFSL